MPAVAACSLPRLFTATVLAAVPTLSHAAITTVSLIAPSPDSFLDDAGTRYALTAVQPVGSGTFFPFVRLRHPENAQGYNTTRDSGSNATMDVINLPGASSPILAMNSVVTPENKVFLTLDYNDQAAAGKSLITLQELLLVVSTDRDKVGPAGAANNDTWSIQSMPLAAGDQVLYAMSNATDGSGNRFNIQLNADSNSANGNGGSGTADLNVAIDLSRVSNLETLRDDHHFLYVYSRFSGTGSGYEEWSAYLLNPPGKDNNGGGNTIPEPASLGLLALGAAALLARRRAARPDPS